jgi:hypothetical protein
MKLYETTKVWENDIKEYRYYIDIDTNFEFTINENLDIIDMTPNN